MKTTWTLALALATSASTASAASFEPCLDAPDNRQMIQCLADSASDAGAKLQTYLKASTDSVAATNDANRQEARRRGLNDDLQIDLAATQEAWTRYRDAQCGDVARMWFQGTIAPALSITCVRDLTRARTHDLWSAYLTYLDSTPPILPEP